MAWWDYAAQDQNNPIGAAVYQQRSQMALSRWRAEQQAAERKRDSGGIFDAFGDAFGGVLDEIGSFGEDIITKGLQGLEWYDHNIVRNVWDNSFRHLAPVFGQNEDDLFYDDLDTWAKIGAGLIADPLSYLGGVGAAAKGLKGAAMVNRMSGLAKVAGVVEKGAEGINAGLALPITLPLKGGSKLARVAGQGLTHLPGSPGDFFTEIGRGLGRETTTALARRAGVRANRVVGYAFQEISPGIPVEKMSAQTAHELSRTIVETGDNWFARVRERSQGLIDDAEWATVEASKPSDTVLEAYHMLNGGGLPTTKRIVEQFRRLSEGTSRTAFRWSDEVREQVDSIVRSTVTGGVDDTTAVARLADLTGNKDLATDILLGRDIGSKKMKDLTSWLERRREAPISRLDSIPATGTADDFLHELASRAAETTTREIETGTNISRQYMGRWGTGDDAWGMSKWFDATYRKVWTNGMERYLVRPMTEMILGFPFFAVGNVIEDLSMSALGGAGWGRTKWRVTAEEARNWLRGIHPDIHIPETIFESGRSGAKTFALQGAVSSDAGLSGLNRGLGGWLFGGKILAKANAIEADIRRAYYLRRMLYHAEHSALADILDGTNPIWKRLPDHLQERVRTAALLGNGNPSLSFDAFRQQVMSMSADADIGRQIITSGGIPEGEGKEHLLQNLDALADPRTREKVLKEAWELSMRDVTNNLEKQLPMIQDFVQGNLRDIDSISDPDELIARIHQLQDSKQVIGRYFEAYRTEGARLAGKSGQEAQHAYNLEHLKKAEKMQEDLISAMEEGLQKAGERLKTARALSDDGVSALDELTKLQKQEFSMLKLRARELRTAATKAGGPYTPEGFKALQEVYDKYRPKLEEVQRKLRDSIEGVRSGIKSTRLPDEAVIAGGSGEISEGARVTVRPSEKMYKAGGYPERTYEGTIERLVNRPVPVKTKPGLGGIRSLPVEGTKVRPDTEMALIRTDDGRLVGPVPVYEMRPNDDGLGIVRRAVARKTPPAFNPDEELLRVAGVGATAPADVKKKVLAGVTAGPEQLAKENPALARIQENTERFGTRLGKAAYKAKNEGRDVVIAVSVEDGFGINNFRGVEDWLRVQLRAAQRLGNVRFRIEGNGEWSNRIRKTLGTRGQLADENAPTTLRAFFGSKRPVGVDYHGTAKDIAEARRVKTVVDRQGKAQALRTLESEAPGSLPTADPMVAAKSGEVRTRKMGPEDAARARELAARKRNLGLPEDRAFEVDADVARALEPSRERNLLESAPLTVREGGSGEALLARAQAQAQLEPLHRQWADAVERYDRAVKRGLRGPQVEELRQRALDLEEQYTQAVASLPKASAQGKAVAQVPQLRPQGETGIVQNEYAGQVESQGRRTGYIVNDTPEAREYWDAEAQRILFGDELGADTTQSIEQLLSEAPTVSLRDAVRSRLQELMKDLDDNSRALALEAVQNALDTAEGRALIKQYGASQRIPGAAAGDMLTGGRSRIHRETLPDPDPEKFSQGERISNARANAVARKQEIRPPAGHTPSDKQAALDRSQLTARVSLPGQAGLYEEEMPLEYFTGELAGNPPLTEAGRHPGMGGSTTRSSKVFQVPWAPERGSEAMAIARVLERRLQRPPTVEEISEQLIRRAKATPTETGFRGTGSITDYDLETLEGGMRSPEEVQQFYDVAHPADADYGQDVLHIGPPEPPKPPTATPAPGADDDALRAAKERVAARQRETIGEMEASLREATLARIKTGERVEVPEVLAAAGVKPEEAQVMAAVSEEVAIRHTMERAGVSRAEAEDIIYNEAAMAELFGKSDELAGRLSDWGSVFSAVAKSKNFPKEALGDLYEEAHQNFVRMAKALDVADHYKGINPRLQKDTEDLLQSIMSARGRHSPQEMHDLWKEVTQKTNEDYHRWFTNYDDGRSIHRVMGHIFPFWRYEYQRWPRLGAVAKHTPWTVTAMHRFVTGTGDGAISIPGTPVRVNPWAGGLFATMSKLMADGGWINPYRSEAGALTNLRSLSVAGGFYPGVPIEVPKALFEGNAGDAIPTTIKMLLAGTEGIGRAVPGGTPFANLSRNVQEMFPSSFDRYNTDQELVNQGIHPYQATEEQVEQAQGRASRSQFAQTLTGGMVRSDPKVRDQILQEQGEAARQAGIPEDVIADAIRHRKSPLEATDENGTYYLDNRTRSDLYDAHPQWEQAKALFTSFKSPEERTKAGEKFRAIDEQEQYAQAVEQQLLPAYQAFAQGQIDGKTFREIRDDAIQKLQGSKDYLNQLYPVTEREETLENPGKTQRKDIIRNMYYSIQPERDKTGQLDFQGLEMKRAQLLAAVGATKDEIAYVTAKDDRWTSPQMNKIEDEYKTAQGQMSSYQDLPKYPGMSSQEQELAERGLALIDRIRTNMPNLTTKQALTVLARSEPILARMAQKALSIQSSYNRKGAPPTPRESYWDSNPLLAKYYG